MKDEVVKSEGGFKGITALRFKRAPVNRTRFAPLDLQLLNDTIKLSERGCGKDHKTLNLH